MSKQSNTENTVIIQGLTSDGRKFRPSDWAERISGMLARFGNDHRIIYSPQLKPVAIEGIKCIAMDGNLETQNPEIYKQVMNFATRNNLNILRTEQIF